MKTKKIMYFVALATAAAAGLACSAGIATGDWTFFMLSAMALILTVFLTVLIFEKK